MMEGVKDRGVVRGPVGRLLSDVERNIEHLRSEFDGCEEKHRCERGIKS